MSLQSQITLGKNMSLQRQLDGKYVEFKKAFRSSRRRYDSLEEECISSLYKMLIEAKENKKAREPGDKRTSTPDISLGRPRSTPLRSGSGVKTSHKENSTVQTRPHTSMASRTYKQSYSFKTDGLDISKYTMGRMNEVNDTEKRSKSVDCSRPFSSMEHSRSTKDKNDSNINEKEQLIQNARAQSAIVQRNALSAFLAKENEAGLPTTLKSETSYAQTPDLDDVDGKVRPPSILKQKKGTPVLVKVYESNTQLDDFKPLSVKITHTTPLDYPIYRPQPTPSPRPYSRMDTPVEDELLPLMADDDHSKGELARKGNMATPGKRNGVSRYLNAPYTRSMAPSRTGSEDPEAMNAKSIQNHQNFLTEYSKKSKLFGYVVKSKSSMLSDKKGKKISRSPYVTYQELSSIKSSMKQQETRTRLLLNRSAKLSCYVDQLAMASQYREHLKSLKGDKLSNSDRPV